MENGGVAPLALYTDGVSAKDGIEEVAAPGPVILSQTNIQHRDFSIGQMTTHL